MERKSSLPAVVVNLNPENNTQMMADGGDGLILSLLDLDIANLAKCLPSLHRSSPDLFRVFAFRLLHAAIEPGDILTCLCTIWNDELGEFIRTRKELCDEFSMVTGCFGLARFIDVEENPALCLELFQNIVNILRLGANLLSKSEFRFLLKDVVFAFQLLCFLIGVLVRSEEEITVEKLKEVKTVGKSVFMDLARVMEIVDLKVKEFPQEFYNFDDPEVVNGLGLPSITTE
jgi:hypothetical protein